MPDKAKELKFRKIFLEAWKETLRQDKKWGPQSHPSLDIKLEGRGADRICEEYELPTENRAKFICDNAAKHNELTWTHILVEELVEAVAAEDWEHRRTELVQLIAVIMQQIVDEDSKQ